MMSNIRTRCGADCHTCRFKEKFHCAGCVQQAGKVFWGECDLFRCTQHKGCSHCGQCEGFPCHMLLDAIKNGHNPNRLATLQAWRSEEAVHHA